MKLERILCPTVLSPESDEALLYGLGLSRAYDAKLLVCHCAPESQLASSSAFGGELTYSLSQQDRRQLFEKSLRHYLPTSERTKLDWEGFVVESRDVEASITQVAAERGVSLIVMQSRRRPHRAALLGSTAEAICRTAPCPVLITHSDEREWVDRHTGAIKLKRLLVGYDFSDYSELALKYALSLGQEYQAELHLLHVLPSRSASSPELDWHPLGVETAYHRAIHRLQRSIPEEAHLWCTIKHGVSEGHPYRELLSYAEKHEIDLISLGAQGAGFGMRALFGSNVDRVLRQAPCPVLVARPPRPLV